MVLQNRVLESEKSALWRTGHCACQCFELREGFRVQSLMGLGLREGIVAHVQAWLWLTCEMGKPTGPDRVK